MTTVALWQFSSVGSLTLSAVFFFSLYHLTSTLKHQEYEEKVHSILV